MNISINIVVKADDSKTVLRNLLEAWDHVCALQGWDKDHMIQARRARETLGKSCKFWSLSQLKAKYPKGYAAFVSRFASEDEAAEHAMSRGWLFDKCGNISYHIPDNELRWTVHELKKWSPRGYKYAEKQYRLLCDDLGTHPDDFEDVSTENDWRYCPDGSRHTY